ncbi:MAG: 6-phosphogluconolactonase [Sedimentisphaerales bacterium]|nr:6-phosphogluconolactonase [Sedimentisphaerales bacterium]
MEALTNYKPNIDVVSDPESLAQKSVEVFVTNARKAIKAREAFYVAISGGHTPRRFYELLGKMPQARSLSWDKIHLFWVDERIVSTDSDLSNYKLAADTFLREVAIPEHNVHRIPTEYDNFKDAARCYESTIRTVFGLGEGQIPQFDLIVLGMGVDGHTGSLFPNSYATFDTEDLACVVYVLDEQLNRITLTHPVLCAATRLVVQVSGREKAGILKEVLTSEPDEVRYPIHALWPVIDKVTWLVDKAATELL